MILQHDRAAAINVPHTTVMYLLWQRRNSGETSGTRQAKLSYVRGTSPVTDTYLLQGVWKAAGSRMEKASGCNGNSAATHAHRAHFRAVKPCSHKNAAGAMNELALQDRDRVIGLRSSVSD